MPRPAPAPGMPYAGRRADAAVLNVTMDREAKELLQEWAPHTMGAFVSRLVFEHRARCEERDRTKRLLASE